MIKASLPTANASSLSEAGAGGLTISASYSPLLHTVHASVSSGSAAGGCGEMGCSASDEAGSG
jgi:hypothetical protein